MIRCRSLFAIVAALTLCSTGGSAQDLEPRTYANAPVGLNFLVGGYGYSSGNVLVDQALPVEEGQADLHLFVGGYVRTLDLFGKSGKLKVVVPFTRGSFEGIVNGEAASTFRSNFADPRVEVSVGLFGTPALRGREFAEYRMGTIVGASLQIILPFGEYDQSKLVNLGSNRWSFRPQVGVARAIGRVDLELYGSAWIFTDNPESTGGSTLEQRTIYVLAAFQYCTHVAIENCTLGALT